MILDAGGDPNKVKTSQKARFADEGIVDQIMELDAVRRNGKYENLEIGVLTCVLYDHLAKYTLDNFRMEKGKISKEVAARKKADKKADISDLTGKSKSFDEQIAE